MARGSFRAGCLVVADVAGEVSEGAALVAGGALDDAQGTLSLQMHRDLGELEHNLADADCISMEFLVGAAQDHLVQ